MKTPTGDGKRATKKAKGTRKKRPKTVVGWREWVGLPDLGVEVLKAKLDTGARSSALHAVSMRRFTLDGREMVGFKIHPVQRNTSVTVEATAELIDERDVRDSGGRVERRPVIRTMISLGSATWPIELTLSRRDDMGFRMLLGRHSLKKRFVVDPGMSFVVATDPAADHSTTEDSQ